MFFWNILAIWLLSVTVTAYAVTVTWNDNSGGSGQEDYFVIERSLGQTGSFFDIAHPGQDTTSHVDTQVIPGNEYCYRVKAVNSAGESGYSNAPCLTIMAATAGLSQVVCLFTPSPPIPPVPSGRVLALGFNAGSGATAIDASGLNNHGTISGATWTPSGRYESALVFDGVNDWVTVNDAASLDLTTGITLSVWVYPTGALNNWRTIIAKEQVGGTAYFLHASSLPNNRPAMGMFIGGAEEQLLGASTLPLNTWAHLAATYDGVTQRLYVNGAQIASRAQGGAIVVSGSPLRIGGNSVWGEYFQGRIDEVRMYNRSLNQAEIQTDMTTP